MRRAVLSASDILHRAVRLSALVLLAALVGAVALQVVARYGFASPPVWTDELARYAMVWAGLLGATMSFKLKFDPAMFSPGRGSPLFRLASGAVQTLCVLIFTLPILYFCVVGTNGTFARSFMGQMLASTSEAMTMPMIFVGAAVPLSLAIILVHLAARLAGDETNFRDDYFD